VSYQLHFSVQNVKDMKKLGISVIGNCLWIHQIFEAKPNNVMESLGQNVSLWLAVCE